MLPMQQLPGATHSQLQVAQDITTPREAWQSLRMWGKGAPSRVQQRQCQHQQNSRLLFRQLQHQHLQAETCSMPCAQLPHFRLPAGSFSASPYRPAEAWAGMHRPEEERELVEGKAMRKTGQGRGICCASGRGRARSAAADGSEERDVTSDGGFRSPRTKCGRRVEKGKGVETARE